MTSNISRQQRELPRPALLREMTDSAVLAEVFSSARVTRAGLAATTGISKPTISEAVRRLQAAGLLHEAGVDAGRPGRVGTFYELVANAGWICAIQVDQTGTQLTACDLMGRPFHQHNFPPAGDSHDTVTAVRQAVRTAVEAATGLGPIRGTAISVADPVDPLTGRIIARPETIFANEDVHFQQELNGMVNETLVVDNDVNLAAWAERHDGAARAVDDFAYIYLGTGIGMGIYVAGHPVRGAHGFAGEIGELAAVGSRQPSLSRALQHAGLCKPGSLIVDVRGAVQALDIARSRGDRLTAPLRRTVAIVAQAIASASAILDPELFVLGGPVGRHPAMLEPVREAVASLWHTPAPIKLSTSGDSPALQGAILRALALGRDSLVKTMLSDRIN